MSLFTTCLSQAQELLKIIKGKYFDNIIGKDFNGVRLNPVCLSWYPDEMAWQLDFTKKEIRQCDTLKRLHGFLVSETESVSYIIQYGNRPKVWNIFSDKMAYASSADPDQTAE